MPTTQKFYKGQLVKFERYDIVFKITAANHPDYYLEDINDKTVGLTATADTLTPLTITLDDTYRPESVSTQEEQTEAEKEQKKVKNNPITTAVADLAEWAREAAIKFEEEVKKMRELSANPAHPTAQKVDFGKIKEGDEVLIKGYIMEILDAEDRERQTADYKIKMENEPTKGWFYAKSSELVDHFPAEPVKTELELAEEELAKIIAEFDIKLDREEKLLDRYYTARANLEAVKNKSK